MKAMLFEGHKLLVERRRYGTGTFTWLYLDDGIEPSQLGDPWPCITPGKNQIRKAIADLLA